MKLESETIYCDFDEKFIPIDEDVECLSCTKEKAVKVSENYLEVDISYDNGGGSDVTKLYFCDLCYEKHVEKVKAAKEEQMNTKKRSFHGGDDNQIIYEFDYSE